MKRKNSLIPFVAGMLVMLALVGTVLPAVALSGKDITVYPGVNIFIDDQKLNPKDANGNPVEVFIYNGTTYLPVRAVSEALGQPVQWDGSTSSVYIGKHTGENPAVWLCDLDYYDKSHSWTSGNSEKDNLGEEHEHCLAVDWISSNDNSDPYRVYRLNGQYSQLTGSFFIQYGYRTQDCKATCSIYGDGEKLWSATLEHGTLPCDFSLDITGVLELKIVLSGEMVKGIALYHTEKQCTLGDVGLWT